LLQSSRTDRRRTTDDNIFGIHSQSNDKDAEESKNLLSPGKRTVSFHFNNGNKIEEEEMINEGKMQIEELNKK